MEAKTGSKSHKEGYFWDPHSLCLCNTSSFEVQFPAKQCCTQIVFRFRTTSYMSLNSWKPKTHDWKVDPLAGESNWCHAKHKNKTGHPEILCCYRGNKQDHNNVSTDLGWSSWALVWFHGLFVWLCCCMFSVAMGIVKNSKQKIWSFRRAAYFTSSDFLLCKLRLITV